MLCYAMRTSLPVSFFCVASSLRTRRARETGLTCARDRGVRGMGLLQRCCESGPAVACCCSQLSYSMLLGVCCCSQLRSLGVSLGAVAGRTGDPALLWLLCARWACEAHAWWRCGGIHMLCYAVLCYAMLCYAMLCCAMPC